MKIKQNRRRAINLLLGALGAVLVLGAAASSINLMATQTAAQAESMPAQSESVTLRPATQAATAVTGDYRGNVTLNHVVAGVFSDSLATPVPDQNETLAAPYLGEINLAFNLTQEGDNVTGYMLLDGTYTFPEMQSVALIPGADPVAVGPRVTGTLVGSTLQLTSEQFTTEASGQTVTRQFRLIADAVPQDRMTLSGEYRETIWGFGMGESTVIGDFSINRPAYGLRTTLPEGNSPPLAVDDFATTSVGRSVAVNVISNDIDPDGDPLRITEVAAPAQGTVTNDGTTIVYTPNADFVGTDSFNYTIADDQGGTAAATLTITVGRGSTSEPPAEGANIYLPLISNQ